MAGVATWFEIPCLDFARARRFYETIFDLTLQDMPVPEMQMAAFPADFEKGEVGGALVLAEGFAPAGDGTGTVVYLSGDPDLQVILDRVEAAGGSVVIPKTQIPMENSGYFAQFVDSEGNTVGLSSMG